MKPVVALSALLGLAACDDSLGENPTGRRVSGTVRYGGAYHQDLARPGVIVGLFTEFPPQDTGHALTFVPLGDDGFAGGVPFEIRNAPPYDYHLLATLTDFDGARDDGAPLGAYPDACALGGPPTVTIRDDAPLEDLTIRLYDSAGAADPCRVATDVCPAPGKATIVFDVHAVAEVGPDDVLAVAAFDEFPPSGFPSWFTVISGDNLRFPQRVVNRNLDPGSYAVTMCFDRGGDDYLTGACGDEDLAGVYAGGALIELAADQITTFGHDLTTGDDDPVVVTAPEDEGCGG
jgi:hypothetical protein